MSLEKRVLLLNNRGKPILLEDIPDCLGWDSIRDDVVDEMSSLNSIIKLSSSDFTMNRLFIARCKLGRVIIFVVFLVCIHFFLDSTNGRLSYTSFKLDFIDRIVFVKKGDDGRALSRGYGMHGSDKRERRWLKWFQLSNLNKQSHMTLFITFRLDQYLILRWFGSIKRRYYENNRGSNNCPNDRAF